MKTLKVVDGKIKIPKEFELSKTKRKLHIRMPYTTRFERFPKNSFNVTVQCWFRQKGTDKPYIPEGFIEIDGIRFKVKE